MPRDYKHISKKKPRQKNTTTDNRLLPFFGGLSLGLLVALTVYLFKEIPNQTEHTETSDQDLVANVAPVETPAPTDEQELPEPTFDFYKILPNMEVNVSEYEADQPDEIPAVQTKKPSTYVLQVGSFREYSAADQVKAKLALLGINADIQRVVINGQDVFHRVRIGPYENSGELEQDQARLISNNLEFKVLKLTIEDI